MSERGLVESLIGRTFGDLKVIGLDRITPSGHTMWLCKCSCGNTRVYSKSNLLYSTCTSCGCKRSENLSRVKTGKYFNPRITKFGVFSSKDHIVKEYCKMVNRCYNPTNPSYERYHAKGITVDKKWYDPLRVLPNRIISDDIGIVNFIEDMYESYCIHLNKYGKSETTLDRINGKLGYSKENCRWATWIDQNNNLSSNRHIYDGEEILTFTECVRKYLPEDLISGSFSDKPGSIISVKIDRGWTVNQIITYLKYAKSEHILLDKQLVSSLPIQKIDQSIIYDKYPDEKRFPEYN